MQIKVRLDPRPIQRWVQTLLKTETTSCRAHDGADSVALSFAGVAHAQGTMDFSGAQTLMEVSKPTR